MYHLTQSKQGISSLELSRRLGITQNAAWKMKHNSPVKMSQFDHVASHVTATMSAAVSASDAAMITKAIVSAA